MKLQVDKNITINLTPDELKELIAEKCREQGYTTVEAKDVTFDVGTELRGYGMAEHEEVVFRCCTIHSKRG